MQIQLKYDLVCQSALSQIIMPQRMKRPSVAFMEAFTFEEHVMKEIE
jgi:hypothetical protein